LVKQIKTDVALVVTNGLAVFNTCLNNEHIKETILLGGHLRRKTLAFYGGDTLEILSRYRFTKAFLTATSMQNNLELFISSESEASIFSKAVSLAKKSFLVMDSTKLVEDQGSRFVTDLSDIDYLITDDNIDNEIRELIASKTNLIVVK
jgi:DeoR/GlpR family transcriptional regulator of sugar metabolism